MKQGGRGGGVGGVGKDMGVVVGREGVGGRR